MFEKIKTKIEKRMEYVEQKDIKSMRKHPKKWKYGYTLYMCLFLGLMIVGTIEDVSFLLFGLPFVSIMIYIFYKDYKNKYKKAFPNQ